MKKSIGVYKLNDRIFIHAKKGTQSVAAFSEPLYELDVSDSAEKIGNKVRECIESYQQGNDRYDREKWRTVNDPLIKLAGEKDSKTFFSKVLNPLVVLLNGVIHFCPRENHGWKDGFKESQHPNIQLDYSTATDRDLGVALLKALELSSII